MKIINSLQTNTFILIILITIIILIIICILAYPKNNTFKIIPNIISETKENYYDYDYFDCYLKLSDINPQFVNAYMKYNDRHVSNGVCTNARLHITVEPCPTDINGIPSNNCRESAVLTSSKGNPIEFPYSISPMNVGKYFGLS